MLGIIVVICYNLIVQVAFIGHRKIEKTEELRQKLTKIVTTLIEEGNADTFLFGSKSVFDDICLDVVTMLKGYYPYIKRIYIRSTYEYIGDSYLNYLLTLYDSTFFPNKVSGAGYCSYIKRNQSMIDMCDVLVTYFNKNYQLPAGKTSGTKTAVLHALKKKKRIINLYEQN